MTWHRYCETANCVETRVFRRESVTWWIRVDNGVLWLTGDVLKEHGPLEEASDE